MDVSFGSEIYDTLTGCFRSKYLNFELRKASDGEGSEVVKFLKERAVAYHKDDLEKSLKRILQGIEDLMRSDFRNAGSAKDCDRVLVFWNRALVQCKQRWAEGEDGYEGGGGGDDGYGGGGGGDDGYGGGDGGDDGYGGGGGGDDGYGGGDGGDDDGDVAVGGEVLVGGDNSEDLLQLITAHQPKPAASAAAGSQVKKLALGQSKAAAVVSWGGGGGEVAVGGEVAGVVMGQEVLVGGENSEDPLQLITAHQPKPAASAAAGSQVKKPASGQLKPAAVDRLQRKQRTKNRRPRAFRRRSRRNASALANQRIAEGLQEEEAAEEEEEEEDAAEEEEDDESIAALTLAGLRRA